MFRERIMLQLPVYVLRYSLITIKATLKYLTRQEEISLKAVEGEKKRGKTKKHLSSLATNRFQWTSLQSLRNPFSSHLEAMQLCNTEHR